MRLCLNSMGLPNSEHFKDSIGGNDAPIAFIPNGKDGLPENERNDFIAAQLKLLNSHQLENVTVLDLREFNTGTGMKQELPKHRVLLFAGGETFWLRHLIRVSGLEEELPDALEKGDLTYAGYSAPTIIAGVSLSGFNLEAYDNPRLEEITGNPRLKGKVIMQGLGLVPFTMIPHHGNPQFSGLTEAADILTNKAEIPSLADRQAAALARQEGALPLADSQSLICTDETYRITEAA